MDKELDLFEILDGAPIGTKLYSPLCGECILTRVDKDKYNSILVRDIGGWDWRFNSKGAAWAFGEILLFPSREQRDWSKFTCPTDNIVRSEEVAFYPAIKEVEEVEYGGVYWYKQPESSEEQEILMDQLIKRTPGTMYVYKPCCPINPGQIVYNNLNHIDFINDVGRTFATVVKMFGTEIRIKK